MNDFTIEPGPLPRQLYVTFLPHMREIIRSLLGMPQVTDVLFFPGSFIGSVRLGRKYDVQQATKDVIRYLEAKAKELREKEENK